MTRVYSLESYRSIIRQAQSSGYVFVPFSPEHAPSGEVIYLRHDVDYSLDMALKLAEANMELGVQGTFCVLLRSQVYNLLSHLSLEVVRRIHGLGQHVGLHVPLPPALLKDDSLLDARLGADLDFVQDNLPMISAVYSWHNPTTEGVERYVRCTRKAGLVNAYSSQFFRDIGYYSDSNMRHSVEEFLQVVGKERPRAMQLVLHPLYWVAGGSSMHEVFSRTWPYIIREREYEIRLNRFYADALPDGMPESVLQGFADQWKRAAEERRS